MRGSIGVIAVIILVLHAFPLTAADFGDRISWSVEGSILYFPEDNGTAGDPAPILPSLGAALALQMRSYLWLELTEDLYFTHYSYNYSLKRAVPAAIENRSAFVFGFFTGMQVLGRFPLGNFADFRIFGGPAADFRIVALAANLHPDDFSGNPETDAKIQTAAVRKYFWEKARWFMPVAGIGMDFVVNEKFLAGFDMRVWFPMYRIAGDNMPPIEGWRFALGLRISPRKVKAVFSRRTKGGISGDADGEALTGEEHSQDTADDAQPDG